MTPPDENGWMPIETAPRDGTFVLVASEDGSVAVYFWNGHAWDDGDFMSNEDWPSHWQPLPKPPVVQS